MSFPYIEPVPEGWEMRLDDTTKTYYFIDHNTQRTQWQHPVNKLVYRPQQMQTQVPSNGYRPMQIPVGRNPTSSCRVDFTPEQPFQGGRFNASQPFQPPSNANRLGGHMEREPSPRPPEPARPDEFQIIEKVLEKANPVIAEIDSFTGKLGDKNYLRLNEILEVFILELDGIGVDGNDNVRTARRAAIQKLQQAIEMLEFRGSTNGCNESDSNHSQHEGAGDKTANTAEIQGES